MSCASARIAASRIFVVARPAGHEHRQLAPEPRQRSRARGVELDRRQVGPYGNDAKGEDGDRGAQRRQKVQERVGERGTMSSFVSIFMPSAKGWSRPNQPSGGPACSGRGEDLRSARVRNANRAEDGQNGDDRDEGVSQPAGGPGRTREPVSQKDGARSRKTAVCVAAWLMRCGAALGVRARAAGDWAGRGGAALGRTSRRPRPGPSPRRPAGGRRPGVHVRASVGCIRESSCGLATHAVEDQPRSVCRRSSRPGPSRSRRTGRPRADFSSCRRRCRCRRRRVYLNFPLGRASVRLSRCRCTGAASFSHILARDQRSCPWVVRALERER